MKEPFEEHSVYHIYNRANGEADLFREAKNYDFFLQKCYNYIHPVAETYAFCLMPNHFHMMIRIRGVEELDKETFQNLQGFKNLGGFVSQQFSNFFNSYTKSYNKIYKRTGSLFQPNVKRKRVISDIYFTRLILYIHNNPVHHGFVEDMYDWPYSSVHLFVDERQLSNSFELLESSKWQVIDWFGDEDEFLLAHKKPITMESVFD